MEVENVPIYEIELLSGDELESNGVDSTNGTANGDQLNAIKKPSPPPSDGKKRSKKLTRQNSRENGQNHHGQNGALNFIAPQRRWKNSRRSRNGHGRGLPKKNGAGGKGVWGLPGSEILEEELVIDKNDPNYDPEVNDTNIELKEEIAEKTPDEFFKFMEPLILEYFESGDTREVRRELDENVSGSLRTLVTTYAVQIALDHKDSQREMISVLISDLYGCVVTSRDIAKAAAENLGITQIAGLSWDQWNANLVMPLCQLREGAQPLVFSSGDRSSSPDSNENEPNEDDSTEIRTRTRNATHQTQKQGAANQSQQSNKDNSTDGGKSSEGEPKNGEGYSCPECGRFYKLKSSLRNHQKWQCGKEPQFSCPYCVYKAKQKMHINRHLERMHKEKIKLEMSNGIQVVSIKDDSQNLNSTV